MEWDAVERVSTSTGWLPPRRYLSSHHRSYCLHELKQTEEARDNLLRVVEKFPKDPIMRYNLACYEC